MIKREKELKLVITFHTTTAALAMEKLCKNEGVSGRLIPVPREISAGCGLAWCANISDRGLIEAKLEEHHVEVSGIYELIF
jgi:hypothetical protein